VDEAEEDDLDSESEIRVKRSAEDEKSEERCEGKDSAVDLNDMRQINPNLNKFIFDKNGDWCEMELEVQLFDIPTNCSTL
jgi:hypothetical protein